MSEQQVQPRRPWIMRLLGMKRRDGAKYLRFALTGWGWTLVLVLLAVIGAAAFAEYSMQPDFCRSCHIMEPYYQAWHQSTHKNVACTDCHFEPGFDKTLYGKWQASSQAVKWATGTYGSKPHAEIRDSSCMRSDCHEKRLLEGKVQWEVPSVRGGKVTIHFDHAPHLTETRRGKQLRCVSCHSQIVQGQHIVVTLDTCFLCHFKGLEHGRHEETLGGCTNCHGAPKEKIRLATGDFNHGDYINRGVECQNCHADVVKGDGAVPQQACWNCHNQPAQIAKFGETRLLHAEHISAHKVECSACHIKIEHNLTAATTAGLGRLHFDLASGTCGQCHVQMHGGPAELYRGTGGRGVPDMPSPMSRARVSCIACHKQLKNSSGDAAVLGQTFVAVQDSCNTCHGSKYATVLDTWKGIVASALDNAEARFLATSQAAKSAKKAMSATDQLNVARLLDDADHNIRLVELGHGVHNVNYSVALLNQAIESCAAAQKVIELVVPTTPAGGSP